jgi:hypothetical protein
MQYNRVWDYEEAGVVGALDISPAGGIVVAGTGEGLVIKFAPDGSVLWRAALFQPVLNVKVGWHGEYVVVLLEDGSFKVLDAHGEFAWDHSIQFSASSMDLRPGTNLILLGNRYKLFRQVSIHGKLLARGEVPHPIDFVTFAPGGKKCAVACADGHVTMLGYGGKRLWTSFLHRMILGIDVAEKAEFILVPSRERGIVALDIDGSGTGVYELRDPIVSAETDDHGARIIALDHNGNLIHMDREARALSYQNCGFEASSMALDGEGELLALAGSTGPGTSRITQFKLSREDSDSTEFLELEAREGSELTDEDVSADYIEID